MITGFVLGAFTTLLGLLLIYLMLRFSSAEKERHSDLLENMEENYSRLQSAVSELLARADEADQESKYLRGRLSPELSRRLSQACTELVVLGDKVKLIESRLSRDDAKGAGRDILKNLSTANRLSAEIKQIRQEIQKRRDAT